MEQQVLQDISHENIIFFKRILFSIDHIFIEMEKCNSGTLESFINLRKKTQKSMSSRVLTVSKLMEKHEESSPSEQSLSSPVPT